MKKDFNLDSFVKSGHSRENGNPRKSESLRSWIPRVKHGAGSAGVYPDENRDRNDRK
jgi:hypothetical protein